MVFAERNSKINTSIPYTCKGCCTIFLTGGEGVRFGTHAKLYF